MVAADVNLTRPIDASAPDRFKYRATFAAADTEKIFYVGGKARFWGAFVVVSTMTNNPALTVDIKIPEGASIFSQAAIAKAATTRLTAATIKDLPLVGLTKITLTLDGAPGAGGATVDFIGYVY